MNDMLKLTGLWKAKDKNNNSYLSGSLNGITQLVVMPNTFKKADSNQPDYFLYIKPSKKKEEEPHIPDF